MIERLHNVGETSHETHEVNANPEGFIFWPKTDNPRREFAHAEFAILTGRAGLFPDGVTPERQSELYDDLLETKRVYFLADTALEAE